MNNVQRPTRIALAHAHDLVARKGRDAADDSNLALPGDACAGHHAEFRSADDVIADSMAGMDMRMAHGMNHVGRK
jgi:hypothetical protein